MSNFSDFIYSNYEVLETSHNNEIRINCPFCTDDKFHGYINTTKNLFYCQKCHTGSSATSRGYTAYVFLIRVHGLNPHAARDLLFGKNEVERFKALASRDSIEQTIKELTATSVEEKEESEPIALPEGSYPLNKNAPPVFGKMAWKYMFMRLGSGAKDVCRRNSIHYCMWGEYKGRIILPVFDRGGRLVYFQGRAYFPRDLQPKYKNVHSERRIFLPYPIDPGANVILCEGYFDALALGQDSISTLGSSLTSLQYSELLDVKPKRVTVCFDWDDAGRQGALNLCRSLRLYVDEVSIALSMPKDPGSLGIKARQVVDEHTVPFDSSVEISLEMFDT